MKITAVFNESDDAILQSMIDTFKAQSASIKINGVNENGTVDIIFVLAGCHLEGDRGIELKGKLFEESTEQKKETDEAQEPEILVEPIEGEVVDKQ